MNREYRTKQEESKWLSERDPIKLLADWLIAEKLADAAQLASIDKEIKTEIEQAAKFALDTPYPQPEEVDQDVYA
jgi:pyruvate dehydrogenase E1 component alpha subunit